MKIAVLAGGLSSERNISLITGSGVCRALRERGHRAAIADVYLGFEDIAVSPDRAFDAPDGLLDTVEVSRAEPDLDAVRARRHAAGDGLFGCGILDFCRGADIVFLALHGSCGEDGRIQAAFDLLGIPYTGAGYVGSAMAMDKVVTKRIMESVGILTPKWRAYTYAAEDIPALHAQIAAEIGCPCVVKASHGGSSLGVRVAETAEELEGALHDCLGYDNSIVVEEKITGRELTCGLLGDRWLPAVEIIPDADGYDYNNKYNGKTKELCPAPIDAAVQEEMGERALALYRALGLSVYSRADFLLTAEGALYCLEINTLPGMTPTSLIPQEAAAVGLSYEDLCEEIIALSLKERGNTL